MVGQEILVLFIMVRIRAPQPKIKPAFAPVLFLVRGHGSTPATQLPVRQQVDFISNAQSNRHGCPAGGGHLCVPPRESCAPRTDCTNWLRICTAKHYQCFVSVSENSQFSKTQVGNIPYNYLVCVGTVRVNKFTNGSGAFSGLYGHAGFMRYARSVDM